MIAAATSTPIGVLTTLWSYAAAMSILGVLRGHQLDASVSLAEMLSEPSHLRGTVQHRPFEDVGVSLP